MIRYNILRPVHDPPRPSCSKSGGVATPTPRIDAYVVIHESPGLDLRCPEKLSTHSKGGQLTGDVRNILILYDPV